MLSFKQYINEVVIDNKKGRGAVPNNQDVDYFGLRVKMKPSTFLNLAAKTSSKPSSEMIQFIKDGGAIGAPFLQFYIPDDMEEPPSVYGHEGRHRMMAIQKVEGDKPIEVHIFPTGSINRARHITSDVEKYMKSGAFKQGTETLIRGPLWN